MSVSDNLYYAVLAKNASNRTRGAGFDTAASAQDIACGRL